MVWADVWSDSCRSNVWLVLKLIHVIFHIYNFNISIEYGTLKPQNFTGAKDMDTAIFQAGKRKIKSKPHHHHTHKDNESETTTNNTSTLKNDPIVAPTQVRLADLKIFERIEANDCFVAS